MTDKPWRYIELFAGAGGMSRGLEAAGMVCVAHAEIEPHARAVLRQHWPDTPLHGDVTQVDWTRYAGQVDLVAGGSPCQDLSVAGKRAGLAGARSGLFYELIRAWEETGASTCLWENVDGARSSNGGGDFAAVLSAFVGTALPVPSDGWRSSGVAAGPTGVAAWRVLDLQHFGPPQRRRRVFVVAARTGGPDPAEVLALTESVCGHPSPRQQQRERAAAGTGAGSSHRRGITLGIDGEKNVDVELLGALNTGSRSGSGQQPAVISFAERGREGGRSVEVREDGVLNSLLTPNGGRSGIGCGDAVLAFQNTGLGTGLEIASPPPVVTAAFGNMGMESWKPVDVTVTAAVRDHKSPNNDVVGTLDFGGHGGSYNGQDAYQHRHGADAGRPRRLTPLECERLMSWPDQWTATGIKEDGTEYALSDTARYRLCGNGVGSVCATWIASRLITCQP